MKFTFVLEVEEPVSAYGVAMVRTGDVVDLPVHLAKKAIKNPNYVLSDEISKPVVARQKITHVGGPWYELPDGSRVRGRDNAKAALNGAN